MSKQKLHPISAIIHFVKALKDMLLPIIFIVVANGFNMTFDVRDGNFFSQMIPLFIMLAVLFIFLVNGIIKWATFYYWFEDEELRVQYGLFVKKKRFIPFDRIQTLNYKEGIFHRPFGLVMVMVETAGASGKAEAEFTAITKAAAAQIELEMNKAKGKQTEELFDIEVKENVVFTMSPLEQITLATTSGGIGLIIFGVFTALTQVVDFLPIEWLVDEVYELVKYSAILIAVLAFIGLVVAWFLSVVWTMITHFDFKVVVQDERIVITRGLIEKKRITIPLNRVQAVQINENPLRQALGFATVQIESAGGSGEDQKNGLKSSVKLFPLIRKKHMYGPLKELFPHLIVEDQAEAVQSPKRARPYFYRLNFIWFVPVVGAAGYFLFPYGLLTLLLAVPILIMGIWCHKTVRAQTMGNQITIVYRHISRVTFIAQKQRVQTMHMGQSIFQKRRQLASIEINVKSGMMWSSARASHLDREDAEQLMDWYQYK